jgi:hypothetical protein
MNFNPPAKRIGIFTLGKLFCLPAAVLGGAMFLALVGGCKSRKPDVFVPFEEEAKTDPEAIKKFSVREGELDGFLEGFEKYRALEVLFVEDQTDCDDIQRIAELKNLRNLALDFIDCESFPEEFAKLSQLKRLQLGFEYGGGIPEMVFQLEALEDLSILDYKLVEIPGGLADLPRLKILGLIQTSVQYIPDEVAKMRSLREVFLPSNKYSEAIKARLLELNPELVVSIN